MFLKCFGETGTIAWFLRCGKPSKITAEVRQIVYEQMCANDEVMAYNFTRPFEPVQLLYKACDPFLHCTCRC